MSDKNNSFKNNNDIDNLTESSNLNSSDIISSDKIELLEERSVVDKHRFKAANLTATKQVRTKTVNVPIELAEEVLVINTQINDDEAKQALLNNDDDDLVRVIEPRLASDVVIKVDGQPVSIDDGTVEIVLSREVALIKKQVYAVEEVEISKQKHTHKETFDVELKHEELDVVKEEFANPKELNNLKK